MADFPLSHSVAATTTARDRLPEIPDRRMAQSQVHEECWRIIPGSLGDAVITTDARLRITFLNHVAASLTGWTNSEAQGLPLNTVFRTVAHDTRGATENLAVQALRDGAATRVASHPLLIARNGLAHSIDSRAVPIRDASGLVTGMALIFRDVTAVRRQTAQAKDALAYAESIIAAMRLPFLVLDENLTVKTVGALFFQTFRVSPDATEGRLFREINEGQWGDPRLETLLRAVLASDCAVESFAIECEVPGLGKRQLLLNARRFSSNANGPRLVLVAFEDVTERRRAESIIKQSEVRYRRLFESAQDGILILDATTLKIIDANEFMTSLLGYSRHEFLGKELWEIGFFTDKAASQALYRDLQDAGYVRYDHLPLQTRTGERAEVEFISNVYHAGSRTVAQCNIRDISERSRLERALAEQTNALADLHRRKDEFLAILGHELRNPLAPITNAIRILQLDRSSRSPQQEQAYAIIERQIAQMTRMVNDLMEVSRITAGRVQLQREHIDVSSIIERAVEASWPLIEQRSHTLKVTLAPHPVSLVADAARLEQVFVNLLTNAAKYTDQGGTITLAVEQDQQECVIRLRDNGVGISPELMPRVFDLFSQGEQSLDRSRGGLGIGLALVNRIVEMHQGHVDVRSEVGEGTEFTVRLPIAATAAVQPAPTERRIAHDDGPLRVLVVDDNVDAADTLATLLSASGYDVRTAYDGPGALAVALDVLPDVILLDIGLPGLNGYEVATQLRSHEVLSRLVVVAVTGYGRDADRERSRSAGFEQHLVKPADVKKIEHILANATRHPRRFTSGGRRSGDAHSIAGRPAPVEVAI